MAKCLFRRHIYRLLVEERIGRSAAAALLWHHRRARCTERDAPRAGDGAALVAFPDGRPVEILPEVTAAEAAAEMAFLRHLPPAERPAAIDVLADEGPYGSLALAESMLAEARRAFLADPTEARAWAHSALTVLWQVEYSERERRRAFESLARAYGFYANALRILGELAEAERQLGFAFTTAGHETLREPPLLMAELESFFGSLRRDQRRFGEAIAVLERAADRYLLTGEPFSAARVRVKICDTNALTGDLGAALAGLRRAEIQMPQPIPAECRLILRHNEADYLSKLDHFAEAEEVLTAAAPLYDGASPTICCRRTWVQARIDAGLGRPHEALRRFRSAYEGLVEHRLPYEAALVALELSHVLLDLGRHADARALAEEALPAFERLGVHREALAALTLWRRAIEREELTRRLLHRLGRYLRLAAGDPSYRFDL